ncbi:uncharacterized protein BCR38DRAFT_90813 [Pseudomassariella vexata]|uniref:Secreted protein n=1 Tax=Pseudomassariella vexata TaxID=1141098 RepID=A0A1Y2EDQ6_9PEZI|nr:uncharacterized protein BCR38DRAFT_90813 [Pseudomassariella vexata]ORY69713.1 hypothetical protein BCR38DRAFT_90813 [Pseudomassariella vexata]
MILSISFFFWFFLGQCLASERLFLRNHNRQLGHGLIPFSPLNMAGTGWISDLHLQQGRSLSHGRPGFLPVLRFKIRGISSNAHPPTPGSDRDRHILVFWIPKFVFIWHTYGIKRLSLEKIPPNRDPGRQTLRSACSLQVSFSFPRPWFHDRRVNG